MCIGNNDEENTKCMRRGVTERIQKIVMRNGSTDEVHVM